MDQTILFKNFYTSIGDLEKSVRQSINIASNNSKIDVVFFTAHLCPENIIVKTVRDIARSSYNNKVLIRLIE